MFNMSLERIGQYTPTTTSSGAHPNIHTRVVGHRDATYGGYVMATGYNKSAWINTVPVPVGYSGGLTTPLISQNIYEIGFVSSKLPASFSFMDIADGWVFGSGGLSTNTIFCYKIVDPSGTYREITGVPMSGAGYYPEGYGVVGGLFRYWYVTGYNSSNWRLHMLTMRPETTSYDHIQFSTTDTSLRTAQFGDIVHMFSDGSFLAGIASTYTEYYYKFIILDINTMTAYVNTDFSSFLQQSGFLTNEYGSGYSVSYTSIAVLDNRFWMTKIKTVSPVKEHWFARIEIPPEAELSNFHQISTIYWGGAPTEELLEPPIGGSGTLRIKYVPDMIGGILALTTYGNNSTAWGLTKIVVGPPDPTPPEPSDDPYQEEGGISEYGGGGGGVDMDESDDVGFPTLPQNLIADCGLVSFYNPTKQEIMDLADQILSQSIGGAIKNFFTDPLDGIVSLSLANVTPPLSGTRGEIKVGLIGTGVTANLLSSSYMELDCGTIQVGDKTKGNALDFTPYTKAELYLPFIGTVSVSPDDFMYSSVNIKYNIDLLSGTCVANVRIAKDGKNDVLYSLDGNVLSQVPLSGKSYAELIKALSSLGAALVLGGSAGAAVAGVAGATLTNSKPAIARSGRMTLATGVLSPKKPYLIFSRPKQSLPEKFKSYKGYPSNVTTKLSEIIGFTQVKEIHIEGIPATSEELTMIEDQLKEGVII